MTPFFTYAVIDGWSCGFCMLPREATVLVK